MYMSDLHRENVEGALNTLPISSLYQRLLIYESKSVVKVLT